MDIGLYKFCKFWTMIFPQFGLAFLRDLVMETNLLWLISLWIRDDEIIVLKQRNLSLKSGSPEEKIMLMVSLTRLKMEAHLLTSSIHCLLMTDESKSILINPAWSNSIMCVEGFKYSDVRNRKWFLSLWIVDWGKPIIRLCDICNLYQELSLGPLIGRCCSLPSDCVSCNCHRWQDHELKLFVNANFA